MQLPVEQAQQKAEQSGRQNSYSPKTPEEKRDIVSAFRQYLNGEIDTETLRGKAFFFLNFSFEKRKKNEGKRKQKTTIFFRKSSFLFGEEA